MPEMRTWCSLVNIIPCHGIDRRFKSGRPRKMSIESKNEMPFRDPLVPAEFYGMAARTELLTLEHNENFVIRQVTMSEMKDTEDIRLEPRELAALYQKLYSELSTKYGIDAPVKLIVGKNEVGQETLYSIANKIKGLDLSKRSTDSGSEDSKIYSDINFQDKFEQLCVNWLEYFIAKYGSGEPYLADIAKARQYVYGEKLSNLDETSKLYLVDADVYPGSLYISDNKQRMFRALQMAASSLVVMEQRIGKKLIRAHGAFDQFFSQLSAADKTQYHQYIIEIDRRLQA